MIRVEKPGLSTSIQDLGRIGYQQFGMVVSGAMDSFALQVGNLLVGNERDAAGIEIVMMGPKLEFLQDTFISICGADLSPKLNGEEVPMWSSLRVKRGDSLTFGQPKNGVYSYVTVAGGITTPVVMGSRSTYAKAEIGGLEGRFLQKDDILTAGKKKGNFFRKRLVDSVIPSYTDKGKIRVILGPDDHEFSPESIETFLSESFEVTKQTDRMGTRLQGPKLEHIKGADIISDSIFPGTIQVPANGQPIILLAERQTTGGYTRIATVISVDIARVAQNLPGKKLQFEAVTVEKAQQLYVEREKLLRKLAIGACIN